MPVDPVDLSRLKLIPFAGRRSLVEADAFSPPAPVPPDPAAFRALVGDADAADRLAALADRIARAAEGGRRVALGMGAHAVKLGLGAHLADMIARRAIHSVAMNGAAAYHDLELAVFGATSEDVARELPAGRFGMAAEPAALFNEAAVTAYRRGGGLGEALAEAVAARAPRARAAASVLASCRAHGATPTVHVCIGTDVTHMHPSADGAALGAASFRDFRTFCALVGMLAGGVYVNLGSAVVLPEVFLKAVSVAINLGADLREMTTANLDMIDHYRPRQNVVARPPGGGIDIRGRHEQLVPALRAAVLARMGARRKG